MKKHLPLLVKLLGCFYGILISQMVFGQFQTWTGDGDGINWTDPANWETNTIPSENDLVRICGATTRVQINAAGQVAQEVKLKDGAKLEIIIGDLTLSNAACCGINMTGDDSLYIAEGAELILTDLIYGFDIYQEGTTSPSVIQNEGTIHIGPYIEEEGFDVYGDGRLKLINEASGQIIGDKIEGNFFKVSSSAASNSEIINHGNIDVHLFAKSAFLLNNQATMHNYGTIMADSSDLFPVIDLEGNSIMRNHSTGKIDLSDFNNAGINLDESSTFTNDGVIEMEDSAGGFITGEEGIDLDDNLSQFINNGSIQIIGLEGDASIETAGIFENHGKILLSSGQIGDEIIKVRNGGQLNNDICGIINIASTHAIKNEGDFSNNGILTTVFTGDNINNGNFLNHGTISTIDGLFQVIGNALTGAGTITTGPIPALDGTCDTDCPDERNFLVNTFVTDATVKADNTITTDGDVVVSTGNEVIFQAGTSITLKPGFTAEEGTYFTAKIAECVSVITFRDAPPINENNIHQLPVLSLSIAPNPFDQYTHLQFQTHTSEPVSLALYDAFGGEKMVILNKIILDKGMHSQIIQTSHLPSGMYFLNLAVGKEHLLKKIIISR